MKYSEDLLETFFEVLAQLVSDSKIGMGLPMVHFYRLDQSLKVVVSYGCCKKSDIKHYFMRWDEMK